MADIDRDIERLNKSTRRAHETIKDLKAARKDLDEYIIEIREIIENDLIGQLISKKTLNYLLPIIEAQVNSKEQLAEDRAKLRDAAVDAKKCGDTDTANKLSNLDRAISKDES